eukprot:5201745-Prymnesium_polylepis.1
MVGSIRELSGYGIVRAETHPESVSFRGRSGWVGAMGGFSAAAARCAVRNRSEFDLWRIAERIVGASFGHVFPFGVWGPGARDREGEHRKALKERSVSQVV